jgi:threonine dehydratase
MKALDTYIEKFGEYEKTQASQIFSGRTPFMVELFDQGIEEYFEKVDRKDVIEALQKLKQKPIVITEPWAALKLEGMHSLHLEKAMKIRYASYNSQNGRSNILEYYISSAIESAKRSAMIEVFKEGITKFSSSGG